MTKPGTHTTTTSTTTTSVPPTTMEKVKDKVSQVADKIAGKPHDPLQPHIYHDSNQPGPGFHGANQPPTNTGNATNPAGIHSAGQQPINPLNTQDRHQKDYNNQPSTMPMHTGAAAAGSAVPQGNTVDRAAYQDTLGGQQGAAGNVAPPVPPRTDDKTHHGIFGHKDKHDKHQTTATAPGGAYATTDPNLVHPSVIPHQQTTAGGVQNPAVAGPTGTSHVPTYNQNVPPTGATAGQVYPSSGGDPMGTHQDRHYQAHVQSTMAGPGATTTAAGTQIPPTNASNNPVPVNQAAPVYYNNAAAPGGTVPQTVPAMGAPGTTTAAGTHMPNQYGA
ncbi:hypothetical protein EC957_009412 [Mortierella hygrophila]|uniref:Uncharacterized protein n=1 Tax=Mortierella hygrophila TaxID=979708 RepID=A0A9P6FBU1_9FUNG|nr:hypothetical protein EC957_009412 [Mortierella hygrophila]